MSGSSFELAITTIGAILETLSDDDFVNVIAFSDFTRSAVPCFTDKMVRGTPDNKKEIMAAIKAVKCENVANFTAGFEYAFELLHRVSYYIYILQMTLFFSAKRNTVLIHYL